MGLLQSCSQLIAKFEGCSLSPYLDVKGIPTIGYGSTYYENDSKVTMDDDDITQARALSLLNLVTQRFLTAVQKLVTVDLTDNQTIALVSFDYNTGALKNSTLLKKLNAGDVDGAADEFLKWDHAGSSVNAGLAKRRTAEREIFLS